jgi:hypothetical protein
MQTPGVTPVQPGEIFVSPSGDKFTIPTSISDPAPLDLGALNFVLKDADGFVLMSTSSGDFTIKPNTQERFQGLALEGVSFADAKRTRRIAVRYGHGGPHPKKITRPLGVPTSRCLIHTKTTWSDPGGLSCLSKSLTLQQWY